MNRILTDLSPFFRVIFARDLDTDLPAKIISCRGEGQLVDRDSSGFKNDFGLVLFLSFIFRDLFLGNNLKRVFNDPSLWQAGLFGSEEGEFVDPEISCFYRGRFRDLRPRWCSESFRDSA